MPGAALSGHGSKTIIGCETCVENAVCVATPSPQKERADLEGVFAAAGIPLQRVPAPADRFQRPPARTA